MVRKSVPAPPRLAVVDRTPAARQVAPAASLATEQSFAALFVAEDVDRLRYDVDRTEFRRWDGRRWAVDTLGETMHEIGLHCARLSDDGNESSARRNRRWGTVAGVAQYVRHSPAIAVRGDAFDANPYLLGAANGIIDLRTGELLPHDPARMVSRLCRVAVADRDVRPRHFIRALLQIFRGRRAMVRYIQRLFGYVLVGVRPEHVIVFFFGGGGNGKSTIVETVTWLLGDYAATAAMSTFEEAQGERHPTELARLAGARLVTASENSRARKLAVELLKRLTGGDRIAARFMRADYFEFLPQFVPILIGNQKPRLPAVDDGIARRLHFVHFDVRLQRPDSGLPDALRAEGDAILRWLVDGCLAWQRGGLRPPRDVVAATREYLETQDLVAQFVAERCVVERDGGVLLTELVAAFGAWARPLGAPELSGRALADDLEGRGYRGRRTRAGKRILGIQLVERDLVDRSDV
ncbi:MAG: phage/plasmid primase, P4 family [Pseudomonadota bacterium]